MESIELPSLLFYVAGLLENGYLDIDGVVRRLSKGHFKGHFLKEGSGLGQVVFNAADLEVRCKRRIDAVTGSCPSS